MKINNDNITAAEEVLLAAANITSNTKKEFTEWDLTVGTWSLNKNRWGLRGYEDKYPDHKRVMNEVMAAGTQKVVGRGWIERVKPNYYRLTDSGLAKVASLSNIKIDSEVRSLYEYDAVSKYIQNSVFEGYCRNSAEPKTWLGAAAFLGLKGNDPDDLNRKLKNVLESADSALKWLGDNDKTLLCRSDSTKPITKDKLLKLKEFIGVLEKRFKAQFEAIRQKKK
jgi:hypothetical protein